MCGIWASSQHKTRELALSGISRAVRALAHRGPDNYGFFQDPEISLVHTRLSIIDLSGGGQPLESFDNRYIGIVNGELYDFEKIRDELEKNNIFCKSRSDSEVLLNLFASQGSSCLAKLSGEFAFIFYDKKEKLLFFGRDQYGVKPLFIRRVDNEIRLGSEMKSLIDNEGELAYDSQYVQQFLSGLMIPPRTFLKGIEHVLPSRVYCFNLKTKKLSFENYKKFFENRNGHERTIKASEAIEKVGVELNAAVKRRLRSDVPVGAYLSGGIDSALITSLICENGAKLKTFTVGFEQKEFDESEKAAEVARFLGLEHNKIILNQENYMPSLKRSILAFENPIYNTHGAAKNLLAHLASQSVRVVLSGEGSDEWFAGYPYLRINKILEFNKRHPRFALDDLSLFYKREGSTAKGHLDSSAENFSELVNKYFPQHHPALLRRIIEQRHLRLLVSAQPESVIETALSDLSSYFEEDFGASAENRRQFDVDLWMGLRTDLLHYILSNVGDRQEMSHSLEGRTPFLDTRVTDLAQKLDPSVLIRGLNEKFILKHLTVGRLPKSLLKRRKFAFFAPTQNLFTDRNNEELISYVKVAQEKVDILPWQRINKVIEADPDESRKQNLLTSFYSMGVILSHLKEDHCSHPRGYKLPTTHDDLNNHEFISKN
ncbi:MAG: asparagine synthase (glutamine-hydrolyzing) [Proteobacteria bacterium]|nr:asparagine synthase (glutamine-hydrolyzing) [Pseudomonadota bacterium]